MAKFWIIEKGRVIFICPTKDNEQKPKEVKKQMAKAIIQAIKESKD